MKKFNRLSLKMRNSFKGQLCENYTNLLKIMDLPEAVLSFQDSKKLWKKSALIMMR